MSLERFNACLAVTLQFEGGFSDDPQDSGGATNLGIEFGEWNRWKLEHGESASSLEDFRRDLRPSDVAPLYLASYWEPVNDGTLPPPVDMVAFDAAVNEGMGKGRQFLAETASITTPKVRAFAMNALRRAHYRGIVADNASQGKFLAGWLNRIDSLDAMIRKGRI